MVKIAIDAGHGLYTAGKRCLKKLDAKETREWVLNDRIADKLQELLKGYDCEVLRTDDTTGKTDVDLQARCDKANQWDADIFISIHHNAGLNGRNGGGTNVYYGGAKNSAGAKRLYDAVIGSTGLAGNRADKTIDYAFHVIKYTKCTAYLIENGFMDSPQDVPVILSEAHATKTAQGILNFLVKELKLKSGTGKTPSEVIYRVQCGAYSIKANAEALQKKLRAAGFEAVIVSGSK